MSDRVTAILSKTENKIRGKVDYYKLFFNKKEIPITMVVCYINKKQMSVKFNHRDINFKYDELNKALSYIGIVSTVDKVYIERETPSIERVVENPGVYLADQVAALNHDQMKIFIGRFNERYNNERYYLDFIAKF